MVVWHLPWVDLETDCMGVKDIGRAWDLEQWGGHMWLRKILQRCRSEAGRDTGQLGVQEEVREKHRAASCCSHWPREERGRGRGIGGAGHCLGDSRIDSTFSGDQWLNHIIYVRKNLFQSVILMKNIHVQTTENTIKTKAQAFQCCDNLVKPRIQISIIIESRLFLIVYYIVPISATTRCHKDSVFKSPASCSS